MTPEQELVALAREAAWRIAKRADNLAAMPRDKQRAFIDALFEALLLMPDQERKTIH